MKKITTLLVCLVLALSLSICVFASGTTKVESAVSVDTAKLGDTVTVTVSLSNCEPFKSMALTPVYDANVFEMVSGEWLLTDAQLANFNKTNAAIAYSTAVVKNGAIFKYVLKIKDAATLKNTTIKTDAVIKNGATTVTSTVGTATVNVICKEHTFGAWVKEAANHKRTCSACDTVESVAHAWDAGKQTTAPTCKDAGVKTFTCTVCAGTKTEAINKTNDHTFGDWAQTKAPTCTDKGTESRTCSTCKTVDNCDVNAAGHTLGSWTTTKSPTCEAKGEQTRTCSKCTYKENNITNALGHKFADPTIITQPTCTTEGLKAGLCERCDEQTEEKIPVIEHTYGAAVVTKEPTATETGIKTSTCTACTHTKQEVIPALGVSATEPQPTEDNNAGTDIEQPDNDTPWAMIAIIAVALIAVAVVLVLIYKKKK